MELELGFEMNASTGELKVSLYSPYTSDNNNGLSLSSASPK